MENPPQEESDQLPEENPSDYVVDDDAAVGKARDEAHENPGVPGEGRQATGNESDVR